MITLRSFVPFKTVATFLMLAASCMAQQDVSDLLEPIRVKYNLPSITAAVIDDQKILAQGVTGVRKAGEKEKATLEDLWHLGSETKAITATLAGTFVADGSLKWSDPVTLHFPEFSDKIHESLRNVTIADLLSHRAGLTANLKWGEFGTRNLSRERLKVAKELLTSPPASPVGSYAYSNAGYVVVGTILEKLGKKPWEELLSERVFAPLGMKHIGFGGTGTPGKIDQPWPHLESGQAVLTNGPAIDNAPVMGPAGTCHASIRSWGLFLSDQLRGASGEKALFPVNIYEEIQSPHPKDATYGFGWGVVRRPWAGGKALTHTGSNTMNFAVCWLAPAKRFGILVCTNQAGADAGRAADEAVAALIDWRSKL